jgi:hypothetical protein
MGKLKIYIAIILANFITQCNKQPAEAAFKRQIKYVRPLNGLWLREAPSKSSKKLQLLPYSMSVEIADSFSQKDMIDGLAGTWRKIHYGSFAGYAFDGYLVDDYAELMKSNQYIDQQVNQAFFSFQSKSPSEQDTLISQIIKTNNELGDPVTGNKTGNHCLFGLEWRYCNGVMATQGNYAQKSYKDFLADLKANIQNPKSEFFDAHLKCLVMVGCYACDGGYFIAKKVLIPHLISSLRSTKITSIEDSVREYDGRKEYIIQAESATPTEYQKHITFLVNQEMGSFQIIAALGEYSSNLRNSFKDKCYP